MERAFAAVPAWAEPERALLVFFRSDLKYELLSRCRSFVFSRIALSFDMDPLDSHSHSQYTGIPQSVYQPWSPEDGLAESRVPGPSPFGSNISPSHSTQPGYGHHYESRPITDSYSTSVPNTIAGPPPPPPPLDTLHQPRREDLIPPTGHQSHLDYNVQRRSEASVRTPISFLSLPNFSLPIRSDLRSTGMNKPGDLPDVIATHAEFSISRYKVPEQLEASQNRYDSTCSTTADTITKGSMPFKIRRRRYQDAQQPLAPIRNEKAIRQERDRSLRMQYEESLRASGQHSSSETVGQVAPYTSTTVQHAIYPATSYERVTSDTHSSTPSIQSSPASALSMHHQAAPWNSYSPQTIIQPESSRESSTSRSLSPLPSISTPTRSEDPQPSTVFIHSNVPRTATTSSVQTYEDYPEHQRFFPLSTEEHRRLRIAMHDVMNSEWKKRNELEPTSADILQFSVKATSSDGTPSFKCLLYHDGEACAKTWSRAERMLAHLRGAIELRPFACEGEGDLCNCGLRFFAEDTLQQHRKNTKTISCQYCSASVTPRNIRRHYRANCPNYPAQGA